MIVLYSSWILVSGCVFQYVCLSVGVLRPRAPIRRHARQRNNFSGFTATDNLLSRSCIRRPLRRFSITTYRGAYLRCRTKNHCGLWRRRWTDFARTFSFISNSLIFFFCRTRRLLHLKEHKIWLHIPVHFRDGILLDGLDQWCENFFFLLAP